MLKLTPLLLLSFTAFGDSITHNYRLAFQATEGDEAPATTDLQYVVVLGIPVWTSTDSYFQNFQVTWRGITFDLSDAATHPVEVIGTVPGCFGQNPWNSISSQGLLTNGGMGNCPRAHTNPPGVTEWRAAIDSEGKTEFTFRSRYLDGSASILIRASGPATLAAPTSGAGVWATTDLDAVAPPVPEPSTWAMLAAGVGILAWQKRR